MRTHDWCEFQTLTVQAMSIDPSETCMRLYSEDLRWGIVWQREVLGLFVQDVASHLARSGSFHCKLLDLCRKLGLTQGCQTKEKRRTANSNCSSHALYLFDQVSTWMNFKLEFCSHWCRCERFYP